MKPLYVLTFTFFLTIAGLWFRHLAAGWLMVFLLLVLPVNIYAALHRIDYQKGTSDGSGPEYLWIRIPLQAFFIGWIWYFSW